MFAVDVVVVFVAAASEIGYNGLHVFLPVHTNVHYVHNKYSVCVCVFACVLVRSAYRHSGVTAVLQAELFQRLMQLISIQLWMLSGRFVNRRERRRRGSARVLLALPQLRLRCAWRLLGREDAGVLANERVTFTVGHCTSTRITKEYI